MSTGAICQFIERTPGAWFLRIQRSPYGDSRRFDNKGPFATFNDAWQHRITTYPNPGVYEVTALPDCPHDLTSQQEGYEWHGLHCDRCGDFFPSNAFLRRISSAI